MAGIRKRNLTIVVVIALMAVCLVVFQSANVDGSVALITVGAGGSIDTTNIKAPIVAFVLGQKGLMYNLTLEGSKYPKLKK